MPDNSHYYTSLTVHIFRNFICDWTRSVRDCYILISQTVDSLSLSFDSSLSLAVIYDIDEEQDVVELVVTKIYQPENSDPEMEDNTGVLTLEHSDDSE